MNEQPLLTIVTPAMNAGATIKDTFASVHNINAQFNLHGYKIEHICVLSPSTDRTYEHTYNFSQIHSFSRVIECEQQGVYAAMNIGIFEARGRFIHFLNSDDFVLDVGLYVRSFLRMIDQSKSCMVSSIKYFSRPSFKCTSSWNIKEFMHVEDIYEELMQGLHYPHPGFIASSSLYKMHPFDIRYKYAADYKSMHQILINAISNRGIFYVNQPFIAMDVSGITGGIRAILLGSQEIKSINRELDIKSNLIFRYLAKLMRRVFQKLRLCRTTYISKPSISNDSLK